MNKDDVWYPEVDLAEEARAERQAALAAATEALVKAALAWDEAVLEGPPNVPVIHAHNATVALESAVAVYRKAKGEGA